MITLNTLKRITVIFYRRYLHINRPVSIMVSQWWPDKKTQPDISKSLTT